MLAFACEVLQKEAYSSMNGATLMTNKRVVFAYSRCLDLENFATFDFLSGVLKLVTKGLFVKLPYKTLANSDILQICL